jgi:hypothetical protein
MPSIVVISSADIVKNLTDWMAFFFLLCELPTMNNKHAVKYTYIKNSIIPTTRILHYLQQKSKPAWGKDNYFNI